MKPKRVTLVIVDISGYTQFIRLHKMSAIHAEEIIFDLLETVIDRADYPLTLNKLEGDAAFLYAEMDGDNDAEAACDVARQARGFFKAFYARAQSLSRERADCDCDACRRILAARLSLTGSETARGLYAPSAGDVSPQDARQFVCPQCEFTRRIQRAGQDPGVCPKHQLPLIPLAEKKKEGR